MAFNGGVLIGLGLMLAFLGAVVALEIHSRRSRHRKPSIEEKQRGERRKDR